MIRNNVLAVTETGATVENHDGQVQLGPRYLSAYRGVARVVEALDKVQEAAATMAVIKAEQACLKRVCTSSKET